MNTVYSLDKPMSHKPNTLVQVLNASWNTLRAAGGKTMLAMLIGTTGLLSACATGETDLSASAEPIVCEKVMFTEELIAGQTLANKFERDTGIDLKNEIGIGRLVNKIASVDGVPNAFDTAYICANTSGDAEVFKTPEEAQAQIPDATILTPDK